MSSRERHASVGATATVAAPPSKSSSNALPAVRSGSTTEATLAVASGWEALYRLASPAQQADLLALASKQGLLYGHQLPAATSSRAVLPADEPATWNLLGKILSGQVTQLEPIRPQPFTEIDSALDDGQRHAVAAALATTDICLIQGLPGTGKSRVILEILTQVALRGDRVLFLSPYTAALDHVLEQAGQREALCPLRCVGPEETAALLPAAVRCWTLAERAARLRQKSVAAAKQSRLAAEMQCARRRHEETIWPRLSELLAQEIDERPAMAQAVMQLAGVEAEVRGEVDKAAETPAAREILALGNAQRQRVEQLDRLVADAEKERDQSKAKVAQLDQTIAALAPVAAAKQQGRWWAIAWWRALFKGDVAGRLAESEKQRQQAQIGLDALEKQLLDLAETRASDCAQAEARCRARFEVEIKQRSQRLQGVVDHLQAKLRQSEVLWNDLCRQIEAEDLWPRQHSVEALAAAQGRWHRQRLEDEDHCALLREWSQCLESSVDTLTARLPGYANVVAATPAGLAADPNFGDAAASGGQFDLLIVDDADHLTESDFLKSARRARSWILVGEPPLAADARPGAHDDQQRWRQQPPRGLSAVAGRGQYFQRLWEHLHCDPSLLPYAWFREGERLGCRLRRLAPEQRQWLESEPLADSPDVELRILALPRVRPVLAEVLFPAALDVARAKEFLFRELQELTVQTAGCRLRWSETAEKLVLHFEPAAEAGPGEGVALDQGIREILAGDAVLNGKVAIGIHTCQLEFERSSGWDRPSAEHWVEHHLHLRDLGRAVWLDVPHRMTPALAGVISDLAFGGVYASLPAGRATANGGPAVEFVAVPAPGKGKNGGRGPRKGAANGAVGLPASGGGLELDLAAPRHSDRLPSELRAGLPNRGFVNYLEARAVVRKLEELYRKTDHRNDTNTALPVPATTVIALFPAQAELIRQLIKQTPALVSWAAAITVGVSAAFRHREAEVVLISLTRSHTHRAVAYGEGPATLALALTRAQRQLILVGDPGNLVRRSQWQGVLDHLDEAAADREGQMLGQLVRYLQGQGLCQQAFRLSEGSVA
jgi:hypothetical protein